MIRHITYANKEMSYSGKKCRESALANRCDESILYTHEDIDPEFYEANRSILDQQRGAGFWLWKPFIILRELKKLNPDDILIYTDAGLLFIEPVTLLTKEFDGNIMLFGNRWDHKQWCKMDVLVGMGVDKIKTGEQLQASCVIARRNEFTHKFLTDWLEWCQKPGYIDDSPSVLPNVEGFREARHDQAILTNMAYLNNIKFNWWPCQYSLRYKTNYSNTYPVMFYHHRRRNNEW